MICDNFFENADYFTSDFLKQCKHNANVPNFLLKYTNNIIKQIALEGGFYLQVLIIRHYIMKSKFKKQAFFEKKDQNNYSAMNNQNEDENYMGSDFSKTKTIHIQVNQLNGPKRK